jgi:hypothetical protein
MRYHVWPWDRPVNKTTVSLERQGGVSYLREVLDLDPWTGADGEKPTGPVNRAS